MTPPAAVDRMAEHITASDTAGYHPRTSAANSTAAIWISTPAMTSRTVRRRSARFRTAQNNTSASWDNSSFNSFRALFSRDFTVPTGTPSRLAADARSCPWK